MCTSLRSPSVTRIERGSVLPSASFQGFVELWCLFFLAKTWPRNRKNGNRIYRVDLLYHFLAHHPRHRFQSPLSDTHTANDPHYRAFPRPIYMFLAYIALSLFISFSCSFPLVIATVSLSLSLLFFLSLLFVCLFLFISPLSLSLSLFTYTRNVRLILIVIITVFNHRCRRRCHAHRHEASQRRANGHRGHHWVLYVSVRCSSCAFVFVF